MKEPMTDLDELKEFYAGIQLKLEELKKINSSSPPDYIYHYTTLPSLISILRNDSMYLSNCEFMNDNSEIIYIKSIIDDILENDNELRNVEKSQDFFNLFKISIADSFDLHTNLLAPNIFILSLTESDHSLSMWSGYADTEGYRIKFDYSRILNEIASKGNHSFFKEKDRTKVSTKIYSYTNKVIYDKKVQYEYVKNILLILAEAMSKYGSVRFDTDEAAQFNKKNTSDIFWNLFFFASICKDPCFSYEEEHRIVIAFDHLSSDRLNVERYRSSRGSIIPYIEIEFVDSVNFIPITEIQIGPKINIDTAEKGLSRYLENSKYNNVKITKSIIPLR